MDRVTYKLTLANDPHYERFRAVRRYVAGCTRRMYRELRATGTPRRTARRLAQHERQVALHDYADMLARQGTGLCCPFHASGGDIKLSCGGDVVERVFTHPVFPLVIHTRTDGLDVAIKYRGLHQGAWSFGTRSQSAELVRWWRTRARQEELS